MVECLKLEGCECYYDGGERIMHITYRGILTAEATQAAYGWALQALDDLPDQEVTVQATMKLAHQQDVDPLPRVMMAKSVDEARAHFAAWHEAR